MTKIKILWKNKPHKNNYPAAKSYLQLIYKKKIANRMVEKLKKSSMSEFKAKDIFRASRLSLLGVSNFHVIKDKEKIKKKIKLSPILLVRDEETKKLIIADGYHRLCAVYHYHEDALIPCKII